MTSEGGCMLCKPRYWRHDHDVGLAYKEAEAAEPFLPDRFQEGFDEENFSLRKNREQESWLEFVDHESEYSPYDDGRGYYAPRYVA
jgi:hypothetical protein